MNVLLITAKKAAAVGGIAVWTEHYLSRCEQHDLNCTLINTEKATDKTFGGIFSEINRTRRIIKDLKKAMRTNLYDIVHLNTSCGPFGLFRDYAIARKLKNKGIPVVTHYHCDIPKWINNGLRRHALKKLAHLSSINLVLCETSRAYLSQFHIHSVKVPNFIKEEVVATQPKKVRESLTRIFFVGRVSCPKGAEEIYELAKRFPEKTFALAGSVVPPVDTWEKPENLRLLGRITSSKVMEILDDADLFLFPSHSEGFSIALMEAMARGVPCLAFDSVGANEDMLADGCGITVPYGDVAAMEQAIHTLKDPAIRQTISENALSKVCNNYTTDAVLSLFKSLYESKL